MYIVSNFHDYYDSAMGLGIDKTVVYKRTTSNHAKPNKIKQKALHDLFSQLPSYHYDRETQWGAQGFVLLVCGEAISGIRFTHLKFGDFCFYSANPAIDFMLANKMSLSRYWSFYRSHYINSADGVRHFFADKNFSGLTKLHEVFCCPIILCLSPPNDPEQAITLNPYLKGLGYQTQKDPYTLFQTIYMYISGVLGTPAKEPRPISDELKASYHGHDGEYSFKTPPGQGKGNRPK